MSINKKSILISSFTFLLFACGGYETADIAPSTESNYGGSGAYENEADYGYENKTQTAEEAEPTANSTGQESFAEDLSLDRKLIKNATLSFETDSLAQRKKVIDQAVKQFKGYVEHEEQFMEYDREMVVTTIRVPGANFDDFMDATTVGVGTFDSKSVEVEDVTEEYVDVEARINTKKELKIRFIALLDKAETIAKIMEVEREINALQAEIESYEARLKYLSGSIKYATVNITYYRMLEIPTEFDNKFEVAFKNGWTAIIWFFVGLVSIWPLVVIVSIILMVLRFRLKKAKSK